MTKEALLSSGKAQGRLKHRKKSTGFRLATNVRCDSLKSAKDGDISKQTILCSEYLNSDYEGIQESLEHDWISFLRNNINGRYMTIRRDGEN